MLWFVVRIHVHAKLVCEVRLSNMVGLVFVRNMLAAIPSKLFSSHFCVKLRKEMFIHFYLLLLKWWRVRIICIILRSINHVIERFDLCSLLAV